ncbi:EamA family transporter RarD [Sphingomonas carotinifaciens]|uniref:Chloramphenicol-sensitive protein RarD n=1 Tax=Sphingomonas carotinifaciens TaxID=1166323 RepID=A0A1G7GC19_9SPHN|nr:EamA family transporter RarD [Sphingomonas carotinifaciens]MBB4086451.1 chloramphenicol-sensitive protein RarD [Sphingomonas carotinifaciens]MWC42803.1 EamA family transporter RarD [Sphingomonas carotinifaciens]SDE85670.1 chloramphenicol-sensitive protein RarD [Sphingomonas carotinifaciens]
MTATASPACTGLILGIGAYVTWGLLPLYLKLLAGVPAFQVVAHRILWSVALLLLVVLAMRRGAAIQAAARGRTLLLLCGSAGLIAVNWLVYIWAVQHAHVLEASLGYFINPLVNVALGVAVLGERVRRGQAVAIGIAAVGVLLLAVSGGGALWISLTLAVTFGVYGLLRKVAAIDALGGLTVETLLLSPFAAIFITQAQVAGTGAFGQSMRMDVLLVLAGAVTTAPLLMFAAAARRMRYATLGLLQYLAPTLQFLQAVLLFGETLKPVHIATFTLIWAGCALYAYDSVRGSRTPATRA